MRLSSFLLYGLQARLGTLPTRLGIFQILFLRLVELRIPTAFHLQSENFRSDSENRFPDSKNWSLTLIDSLPGKTSVSLNEPKSLCSSPSTSLARRRGGNGF